jgi:predicted DNA-binding transcriptional regulator AlpA
MPAFTIPNIPIEPAEDRFCTSADLRRRYNISDMRLYRRMHDDSGFPQPVVVKRLRFWKLSELLSWERKHLAAASKPAKPASRSAR